MSTEDTARAERVEVERALERDDPYDALETLGRWAAAETRGVLGAWSDLLRLTAAAAAEVYDERTAGPLRAASANPIESGLLFDAGYALFEKGQLALARSVLEHARAIAPERQDIVAELVATHEASGDHVAAVAVLRGFAGLGASPMCGYLLGFNALLTGDLDEARRQRDNLDGVSDEHIAFMAERLAAMVERADIAAAVAPLDASNVRGWSFVISASLLLCADEGPDSYARAAKGIGRLSSVLAAWDEKPARVLALPDPDSKAFAPAVAAALGVPVEQWIGSDGVGLVVAYDLSAVLPEILDDLATRKVGQLVFAHVTSRVAEQPVAADVTTSLYATNRAPWADDPDDDFGFSIVGAGAPEPDEVQRAIAAAGNDDPGDADLMALATAIRPDQPGGAPRGTRSQRERRWIGSPVRR